MIKISFLSVIHACLLDLNIASITMLLKLTHITITITINSPKHFNRQQQGEKKHRFSAEEKITLAIQ